MNKKALIFSFFVFFGIVNRLLLGISITDYSQDVNDRFSNSANFIGIDYDFSGVGISSDNKWATMISKNVFITSSHFYPSTNSTITFWETNDKNGNSAEIGVSDNYSRIGNTDIYLGVLDEALSDNYATYEISSGFDTPFSQNNQVFLLGSASSFSVGEASIYQRSSIDVEVDNNMGRAFYTFENTTDSLSDTLLETGDSGAPVFLLGDEGLMTLLGNNWAIGSTTESGQDYHNNVLTDLNSSFDLINDFVTSNAVAIPEPTTIIFVLPIVALGFFRFWRNISHKS